MRACLLGCVLLVVGCDGETPEPGAHQEALAVGVEARPAPEVEPGALAAAWATRVGSRAPALAADLDRDGVEAERDPDDENPFVYPGASEIQCNEIDEDGDGLDACPPDADADGARADLDCDDLDPTVSPLVPEITCNGRDENCNGHDDCDGDGDGAMDWYDLDPDDPLVSVPERPDEGDDHVSF